MTDALTVTKPRLGRTHRGIALIQGTYYHCGAHVLGGTTLTLQPGQLVTSQVDVVHAPRRRIRRPLVGDKGYRCVAWSSGAGVLVFLTSGKQAGRRRALGFPYYKAGV